MYIVLKLLKSDDLLEVFRGSSQECIEYLTARNAMHSSRYFIEDETDRTFAGGWFVAPRVEGRPSSRNTGAKRVWYDPSAKQER